MLITVLVAADDSDQSFWDALTRLLCRHFAVVRTQGRVLALEQDIPSLLLCDTQSFDEINAQQVIVVFQEPRPLTTAFTGAGQVVAIVDSANQPLVEYVSSLQLPAITCGLSGKDSITLSSMDIDSAVIGIQRSIPCFDSSRVEPQELPVQLTAPVDSFPLMAVAAILILSGNAQKLLKGKM